MYIAMVACYITSAHGAFLATWMRTPKPLDFKENVSTQYLQNQDYTVLEPMMCELIEVQHKSKVFDFIEKGIAEKKDPFCLYTYIRSKVLTKRSNGILGSNDMALILRNMLISLMLLAGDLTCCIVFGDESSERDKNYIMFRDNYAHWFTKHLAIDAPDFKPVCNLLNEWIEGTAKIEQPSPYWVRYFYPDILFPYRLIIHFATPKANELRAIHDQAIKDFIMKKRLESQQDFLTVLRTCNDWPTFFKLGLLSNLNKKSLQPFIDGQSENQLAVEKISLNNDVSQ